MEPHRFNAFVLSTCSPSHVRSARRGLEDWVCVDLNVFASPSTGLHHHCEAPTCTSWVLRMADGVKICAISGNLLLTVGGDSSPRKRTMRAAGEEETGKKHQDKPIPGSSAYLSEKFAVKSDSMVVENAQVTRFESGMRLNQYPW